MSNSTSKIAVIGTGKTGGEVVALLGENLFETFNSANPPTVEKLKNADAAIIFVPGNAVANVLPLVLQAGIPAAWGSTGFEWPENIDQQVQERKARWIISSNFSLGMNLIRKSIEAISASSGILKQPRFHIHEVHHIHKKDAPSGTALSWREWLAKEADISSAREGDVKGIHELTVETASEKISLRHEALNRRLFAEGAVWAALELINNKHIKPGIMSFSELFDLVMEKENA